MTVPKVTDEAAKGAAVAAPIKVLNSLSEIVMAVMPLLAILVPRAKTVASALLPFVTDPIVTASSAIASSKAPPAASPASV